ncbi:MAG: asparagine synthase (glutamine-hydrolyzing) [Planctomycetota bacterium]
MCGISGILAVTQEQRSVIPEAWLDVLEDAMAHRGPDGRGRFRDHTSSGSRRTEVALVHRRLSILDHGGGAQPMVSAPARGTPMGDAARFLHAKPGERPSYTEVAGADLQAVVFNGCIYNHRGLRRSLEEKGHAFTSDHSDTEVLLHGTREFGDGLADALDGMYAFAVWSRGVLTLARDPSGEKPLYVTRWMAGETEFFAFSSVAAGLLALRKVAGVGNLPDPRVAAMWLKHGYWHEMPVRDVMEVGPGVTSVIPGAWPLEARTTLEVRPPDDRALTTGSVLPMLEQAVASRLEADVPIGCFLSGGVDSSVIAALSQKALASHGMRLRTFNVKMPMERMDESPYARAVAEHLGTEHMELTCNVSAAKDLVTLIGQLGLPFGDSSLLPTTWVSAAAREHVTVALGGDGGDELFGGYDRYMLNRKLHRLRGPLSIMRRMPRWMRGVRLGGDLGRITTAARHGGYDDILTILRTPHMHALLGSDAAEAFMYESYGAWQSFADARQDDFRRYLPMNLMRKVDTAAMSVALEVRAPMLERSLVGAALSAPMDAVLAGEGPKGMLRQVARTLVPREAIDRKKAGFGVPLGLWFREDFAGLRSLLHDTLESPGAFDATGLDVQTSAVAQLVDEHMRGRRDHGKRLYALLVLSLWSRLL